MIRNLGLATLLLASAAQAAGPELYAGKCGMCHQPAAQGVPGVFPRLAGRVGKIAALPEGRAYLTHVLLFGMSGSITVDDKPLSGFMPPQAGTSDKDLADLLNYLVSLDKAKGVAAFTPADFKRARDGARMTAPQVNAERKTLAAAKKIP